ncbi:MAG: glycogen/starch synthase [Patescibacteria group bacterium]|mgnify:CR=1 FL=1
MDKNAFFLKKEGLVKDSLQVLVVAAEASPYANVGGFSRVVEALSKALVKTGCDVRVFTPKFGFLDEGKFKTKMVLEGLQVPTGDENTPYLICNVKSHKLPSGVTTYFLENMEYYEKRANVYGYSDDPTRWALLSRGALEFLKNISKSLDKETQAFKPKLIHCNDWHTGILANYLKEEYDDSSELEGISTLFTIHNLRFQGLFDPRNISELDFDDGKSQIAPFFSDELSHQNFMKRGIIYSDAVNTVSQTYSREILTPDFGEGLDRLLVEVRGKLYGVLNGLDTDSFNPETDKLIERNFSINSLDNRVFNKVSLQKEFGLKELENKPLLGFVGRLDQQKGVDLVITCIHYLIKEFGVQFVQVGGGDTDTVQKLKELKERFPDNVGLHPLPNFTLPRLFFAGCDIILYPSRFEPCGIVQLEAMRYGAIPVVRKVGGLADSVSNFDPNTMRGTGFVFDDYDVISFYGQLVRAVETYRHKTIWRTIQKNAMGEDFSWVKSAKDYLKLYNRTIEFHSKVNPEENIPVY